MQHLIRHSNPNNSDLNMLTLGQLKRIPTPTSGNKTPNSSGWLLLYLAILTGKPLHKLTKMTVGQTTRLMASLQKRAARARCLKHQVGEAKFAQ